MRCLKRRLAEVVFRALLDDLEASGRLQNQDGADALPAPQDMPAKADQALR